MSRFIQALERRTLLTATSASLAAELAAINANVAPLKADLTAYETAVKADLKPIAADLKGSAKTNGPLLRKLMSDEAKTFSKLNADVAALLKGPTVATKGVADGNAALVATSIASLKQRVKGDVNALGNIATAGTKVATDAGPLLIADLAALTSVNTTNTALNNDANKAKTDMTTLSAKLISDAGKYTTAVNKFKNDLATVGPTPATPTTTPSLIGDYKGSVKTKAIVFGVGSVSESFELNITSQTLNSLTGTITIGGIPFSGTITSSELTNGHFTLSVNSTGVTINLNGTVNIATTKAGLPPGSVITGSGSLNFAGVDVSGGFNATKM